MEARNPQQGSSDRPDVSPPSARRRLLLPREHGAYAEIGFPLLTVLLLGVPGLDALLLSMAVVCTFLLHEPLLVLLGHRGTRIKREAEGSALRFASVLAAGAFGFGVTGLWISTPAARWGALVPLVLGVALLPMTVARREKTLVGELLAATALVAACVPVALAASLPIATTALVSVVWGVSFGLGTLAVRVTVAGAKGKGQGIRTTTLLLAVGSLVGAAAVATTPLLPGVRGAIALIPGSVATISLLLLHIPPRRLRVVGWTIAASNVMALSLLLVLL